MRPKQFLQSLRFKITVGIALPLIVLLSAFSYLQYVRQRDLLLSNLDHATTNLSNVIVGSLQHAMLTQDLPEIQIIMNNIVRQGGIREVFLMNTRNEIRFAPEQQNVGTVFARTDPGCIECHGPKVTRHVFSIIYTNAKNERVFRNCKPVLNLPECQRCHGEQDAFNGVLVTDVSMQAVDESLSSELNNNILGSALAILTTILSVNTLMSRMVVTKLERLVKVIKQFSQGDLTQRIRLDTGDEIGELATSFNHMAQGLGERTRELEHLNEELRRKESLRGQLLTKLITAQEEERKRVARDLHDQLGQALSAMTMGMEAVEGVLPPQLDTSRERLAHAKALATRALEQTHELILDLRPVALDDLGLIAAIRSYAEEHLVPRGIVVQVTVRGAQRRLSPESEIALFRIVQEAINNIATHAAAHHVNLALEFDKAQLSVIVQDDGCGFDLTSAFETGDTDRGFGLLGMRERAELSEGSFQIDSQPGHGTRIIITMPMSAT